MGAVHPALDALACSPCCSEGGDKQLQEIKGGTKSSPVGFSLGASPHLDEHCGAVKQEDILAYVSSANGTPQRGFEEVSNASPASAKSSSPEKTNSKTKKHLKDANDQLLKAAAASAANSDLLEAARLKLPLDSKAPELKPNIPGPFSDGSKLQILLDSGWEDCSEEETILISTQLASDGPKKFVINARGAMYIIDFTHPQGPTQTNAVTKKSRKMRHLVPSNSGKSTWV